MQNMGLTIIFVWVSALTEVKGNSMTGKTPMKTYVFIIIIVIKLM